MSLERIEELLERILEEREYFRYMKFFNGIVIQTSANTAKESSVDLSSYFNYEKQILLIHRVDLFVDTPDIPDGQWSRVVGQLALTSGLGMEWWNNANVIVRLDEDLSVGQAQGTLSEYFDHRRLGDNHYLFDPPYPITQSTIYATVHSAQQAAVRSFVWRVGYTVMPIIKAKYKET